MAPGRFFGRLACGPASRWEFSGLWLLPLLLGVLARGAEPLPPADRGDVAYGPHERHRLDLWRPRAEGVTPLLVFIHGGGWHGGEKSSLPIELLGAMREAGIAVASINYRFTSIARLPGPVHDAARAVQFLRSKAQDWKLDAARVGAAGVSAGGCSALWLACHDDLAAPQDPDPVLRQSTRLQVAAGYSPQTSLDPKVIVGWIGEEVLKHPMIQRAIGAKKREDILGRYAEHGALLREFSAVGHVSKDDPPMLLTFPTMGPLPAANPGNAIHHAVFGLKLQQAAVAVGVECVLRLEDAPGAAPTPAAFLVRHLQVGRESRASGR
jgi:acetyl esterase/lipase